MTNEKFFSDDYQSYDHGKGISHLSLVNGHLLFKNALAKEP